MINKTYINLLHEIMDQGYLYEDPNRGGVYRRQLDSYLIEHNLLKDGFPFITVKETYPNLALKELQLFTSGETDIRKYWAIGVNFWDHDWKRYYKIDQNTPKEELQNLPEHMYNLPGIYPELLTKWGHKDINQVSNLLNTLNDNPMATKKTVTMWNPGIEGVLSPCHHMFQVMVQPLTNICRVQEAIRRGVGDKGYLNKVLYDGECRKASVSLGESIPKYYISLKFHMGSSDVFLG